MSDEMQEIIQDFLVEAEELVEELDEDLVALEASPQDSELLNKIFRAFHTIKGSSSFLGFDKLTHLTHKLEDVLNRLRKFEIQLNSRMMDAILSGVDKMKEMIEAIKNGEDIDSFNIEDNVKALEEFLTNTEEPPSQEELSPKQEQTAEGKKEDETDELIKLQEEEIKKEEEQSKPKKKSDEEIEAEIQRLLAQRMEEDRKRREARKKAQQQSQQKPSETQKKDSQSKPLVEQTIRVNVDRLDALMNLVGELVLGKNRLVSVAQKMEEKFEGSELAEEISSVASQITLVTTDLQMGVMRTRMITIGKVFNKFPRVVRDIARNLNKEVELIIEGADTELDKNVVEEINDPLVHLIRNAIDHGIETPEEREQKGKPRKGKVTLSAFHEGNYIVIEVKDDGRGMDPELIKQKAIEKGIVTPSEAEQMGRDEALALIFRPGFSTTDRASDISGRGVGMDVVKTNIEKLNGIIEIKTRENEGTSIILRIPLTLAIIQALLVKVVNEFFAIPLVSVIETVRITQDDIKKVENRDVLKLRDSIISLVYLGDVLGIGEGTKTLNEKDIYVVIIAVAEKRIGIVVDKLIGREEIVIKSLGNYLTNIKSISGATIMGDGSVTLILDVSSVIREASDIKSRIRDHFINFEALKDKKPVSFIVSRDEKFTERLKRKLIEKGYDVKTESSVKRAFDMAARNVAKLVFVDLEFPVGDGYNFTKRLREFAAYKNAIFVGISTEGLFDKDKAAEAKFLDVISPEVEDNKIEEILEIAKKKRRKRVA